MPIFVAVPGSYLNHKQNVKTREQHKRKKAQAQAKAQHVTVQVQEVESIQISVEKASKYVVLQCVQPGVWNMATPLQAVTPWNGVMESLVMVQHGAIGMRRTGVG